MKNCPNGRFLEQSQKAEEIAEIYRAARNVLRIILGAVVLALLFLGVIVVSGCTQAPEQPDLNTYGAVLPLCVVLCHQVFTLSEGDASQGSLSTSVSDSVSTQRSVN